MSNMCNLKNLGQKNTAFLVKAVLLCSLVFFPRLANAQLVPNDVPTIEAYINDHKNQRSLLLARATLEESNALLHKLSKVTNKEYKDINDELDRYTRAFDIIDLVYTTVSTGFNVYRTYDNVSEKIGKYKTMLTDYNDKIIKRGRIESADTLLLTVNVRAVKNLAEECENLYSSVGVLAAYASGEVCCTTATLMMMVEHINRSMDRIKDIVNLAYYQTWKFIQARTSYWKGELHRSKSIGQMATEAYERWRKAGNKKQ